jgi:hypothetical protein
MNLSSTKLFITLVGVERHRVRQSLLYYDKVQKMVPNLYHFAWAREKEQTYKV